MIKFVNYNYNYRLQTIYVIINNTTDENLYDTTQFLKNKDFITGEKIIILLHVYLIYI
jgi:hypothetical protein